MKPLKLLAVSASFLFFSVTTTFAGKVEDTIRGAYDALNRRDYAAFTKLVTPDFTEYAAGSAPIRTPAAAIEAYKMYFAAFPDLKFTITDIAEGSEGKYYVFVTYTGTNTGNFMMLPPTGKKFEQKDVDIITVNSANLATSHWSANPGGPLTAIGYGSINNPNTGVIMSIYDAFGKNDAQARNALLADNVVFEIQDNVLFPMPKTFKGKPEVISFFNDLGSKNLYTKFQPWRFIADGDDVLVLVSAEFKNAATGQMYTTNYVHHFKVMDGKVSWFKGVADIQSPTSGEMGMNTVKKVFELMDGGKIDEFGKYCTSDFMIENPFLPEPAPLMAFQNILNSQKTAFPDMHHEIVTMTTDGKYVFTRGVFKGTNTGTMMGNPATGKKVSIPFLVMDEVDAAGKIKHRFVQFDNKSFENQLMGK